MNKLAASGEVLMVYQTGDRPILVLCSDGYHYVCKYKQPGYSAYKLANELIGGIFAAVWGIATPSTSLVLNDPIIWDDAGISHDPVAPLLGSRKMENVCDLSEYNCNQVRRSQKALSQLLRIALFDLWLTNEDRTCNNYNLLYDLQLGNIVSIDYGGIFNSGILNNAVYQLNPADSILSSNLYSRLKPKMSDRLMDHIKSQYLRSIMKCKRITQMVLDSIPEEWNVEKSVIKNKLREVFVDGWISDTWGNFEQMI